MSEPFIGEIRMVGFNFAPRGWALADGQLLPISSNSALFSLYGTTYGGDGRTSFALPDLRGRVPVQQGAGPGLSQYRIGSSGGAETVTLNTNQLPPHSHPLMAHEAAGNQVGPTGHVLAGGGRNANYSDQIPDTMLNDASVGATGGNQGHINMQPYLVINFCVALVGLFPSRN